MLTVGTGELGMPGAAGDVAGFGTETAMIPTLKALPRPPDQRVRRDLLRPITVAPIGGRRAQAGGTPGPLILLRRNFRRRSAIY